MGKKLLDNKILYMVLAVLLAVTLWFYVNIVQGEPATDTIENIPITFTGTDVLRENGLMLTGEVPTVNLQIQTDVTTLSKLTRDSITLRVDVSRITGATDYSMGYEIVPPTGVSESSFTVLSHEPVNVNFTVARYDTAQIPIRGVLGEGSSIAEGYVSRGFQFSQETVQVSGRSDLVDQVKSVQVTVSGENLSETVEETKTYQLIGADNQVLEGLDVTCVPETVDVTYEIWQEVVVPLKVNLEPGGGAKASPELAYGTNGTGKNNHVSFFDVEPKSVTVQGRPEDVASLKELTVATINLADVDGTQIITKEIPLADGLEIAGGVNTATITITVDGLEKRTFEISRNVITPINVPEGFQADIRTASLSVTIRGTAEALEEVSPENIRGTVDLSKVEKASGQYSVPVQVQFDYTEGAGVLNSDYQVTVRLRN